MSALLGCTFGEAAAHKQARVYIQRIIRECIDVSRAEQVRIEPVQGKDIVKLFDYHSLFKKKISYFLIPLAIKKHALLKASILQDLEKGKKTEIDYINGTVCEAGLRRGIATPVNDLVVSIIHDIEEGRKSPGLANLLLFGSLK